MKRYQNNEKDKRGLSPFIPSKCEEYEQEKFDGFKKLFDLIKEIKELS